MLAASPGTGMKILHSKKQELEKQAEQLKQWQGNGDTAQLQSYMESDNNRSWMPFMLFSGIMNVLFFTSMMSMMGMALNPMESQMAGDSGAGSEGAGESAVAETDSSSSTGTEGGDVVDTGGADFGGFDGGGFGAMLWILEERTLEDLMEEVLEISKIIFGNFLWSKAKYYIAVTKSTTQLSPYNYQ